jgi:superfamily II DNA helicase RecQ
MGQFRKSYALLETIHHTLGHKPWFGCTATLDEETWRRVRLFAGFRECTYIIRTPIDRPDVAMIHNVVRKDDKNSFKPIQFVVADASRLRDGTRLTSSPGFHEIKASDFGDIDNPYRRVPKLQCHSCSN